MKYLYKYPQAAYPYQQIFEKNNERGRQDSEFELLDTGVFDEDRYFDVQVEYAKATSEDMVVRISVTNHGPDAAPLHLLPTIWFRNTWSWDDKETRPSLQSVGANKDTIIGLTHEMYGERWLYCEGAPQLLFTENDTNTRRLYNVPDGPLYAKDSINDYIVDGTVNAINPQASGTKAAAHYSLMLGAGETTTVRLRFTDQKIKSTARKSFTKDCDRIFASRQSEADEYYKAIIPQDLSEDAQNVMRQSFAGLLWSKQFYHYVVKQWIDGDPAQPAPPAKRKQGRNHEWKHLYNADVISMPDKWEYPWYAAWDLAFTAFRSPSSIPNLRRNN